MFGRNQPTPATDRHPEHCLYCPPIVVGWTTDAGQVLDFMLVGAWAWLYERGGGFPSEFEFRLSDLAARFCKTPGRASRWIDALAAEGLIEILERKRGAAGYIRVRLLDPHQAAGLRTVAADPQIEFEFSAEPDTLLIVAPTSARAQQWDLDEPDADDLDSQIVAPAPSAGATIQPSIVAPTIARAQQSNVFVAAADVPPALLEALGQHLGPDRTEVWLGHLGFEAGPPAKLLLPNDQVGAFVRKTCGHEIYQAAAAAGFPGLTIELSDDVLRTPPIVAPAPSAGATMPAQQPTKVRTTHVSGSSNQPTNNTSGAAAAAGHEVAAGRQQPAASRGGQGDSLSSSHGDDVIDRAAELYARIGDPSLYRWFAIAAVVLIDDQVIPPADVEAIVAGQPFAFAGELKRAAGRTWPGMIGLKTMLARRGVKWRRSWERGDANQSPSKNPPARRLPR